LTADRVTHAFDQALQLRTLQQDPHGGRYAGHTHAAWANMVGPYGGILAAIAVHGAQQHPAFLGQPLALTVNYAGPAASGAWELQTRLARTNRSTQHWTFELGQTDADGATHVVLTGTLMAGLRRATWGGTDMPMPDVPPPEALAPPNDPVTIGWRARYELRRADGGLPPQWTYVDNASAPAVASLDQMWLRDADARPLDFAALAAGCDIFYPRVWQRRGAHTPAGTVSMTVYFHADAHALRAVGADFVLAQARAQEYRGGFFDQTAQLWARDGTMLATTHQLVYYKS
jgi:hypothetical protein